MNRIIPRTFGFLSLLERNLRNRPWRNLAAVIAFAIIAGTLFSAQYLAGGARQSLDNGINRMGADIIVVPQEYSSAGEAVLLTGQPTSFFSGIRVSSRSHGSPGWPGPVPRSSSGRSLATPAVRGRSS